MTRAAWIGAALLAIVIAYSIVATTLWISVRTPNLAERHRLQFCHDFADVVVEHRRDVRTQFHGDDTRYTYITYLGREAQIIVNALRLCVPTFRIGVQTSDWLSQRKSAAMVQESAVDDYLLALEVVELMLKRR
jgi:hypothetical protein